MFPSAEEATEVKAKPSKVEVQAIPAFVERHRARHQRLFCQVVRERRRGNSGRWVVSNSGEELHFYDLLAGRAGLSIEVPIPGDVAGPVGFSPDIQVLAAAMSRTTVNLFDVASGRAVGGLKSPAPRLAFWIAFSPFGTKLAIATEAHLIFTSVRPIRCQTSLKG